LLPHPTDARIKAISAEQLHQIASAHRRMLTALSEPVSPQFRFCRHRSHLRLLAN
jgi:hypothetical protein